MDELTVPDVIPIFPLADAVLLPTEIMPLQIFEPRYLEMVRDALASNKFIGMVQPERGYENQLAGSPPVRKVGCAGVIARYKELEDGRFLIWLFGVKKFAIREELTTLTDYRQVRIEPAADEAGPDDAAAIRSIRFDLLSSLPDLMVEKSDTIKFILDQLSEADDTQLLVVAVQIFEMPTEKKQAILEAPRLVDRYLMVREVLQEKLSKRRPLNRTDLSVLH